MQALVQDRYGPPDVLELREIDRPVVEDDEVLVRVHAVGLNYADPHIMRGMPHFLRLVYGPFKPRQGVRGTDIAGRVEAVGDLVRQFRPGDEVFGWCSGAFAEYVTVTDDHLLAKPADLTFEHAAAVGVAAFTALQALRDIAHLQAGQTALINGASGGVGTFAVQIAKAYGAEVTGVCSTKKLEMVRSLGADHVIDYTEKDFTQLGRVYDVILDNVGNHSLSDLRRVLTRSGTLIPNSGRMVGPLLLSLLVSQKLRPFLSMPKLDDLVELEELIEAGKLTPVIDRTYPLAEAADAMRYLEEGHAAGKVVVTV
jgi:NADPH:quinone reductase-like Zn-dependent oxidoreductase